MSGWQWCASVPALVLEKGRAARLLALRALGRETARERDAAWPKEGGHQLGEPAGLRVLRAGGGAQGRALQVGGEASGELHRVAPAAVIEGAHDPALAIDGVLPLVLDDGARARWQHPELIAVAATGSND